MAGMTFTAIFLTLNAVLILIPYTNAFRFWELITIVGYIGYYWYYESYLIHRMIKQGIPIRDDFWQDLDRLIKRYQNKIPPESEKCLKQIKLHCDELINIYPSLAAQDQYTIRHMISDYIPTSLNNYLRLPRSIRNTPSTGKNAASQLEKQLALLEDSLKEIIYLAGEAGMHEIQINTVFLQKRFSIKPPSKSEK